MKELGWWSIGLICVAAGGCFVEPTVTVRGIQSDGQNGFEIKGRRGNGFLSLQVWDPVERQSIWIVDLNYFPNGVVLWGQPPRNFRTFLGRDGDAKQRFPERRKAPPPLRPNASFGLSLTYQYDRPFAPGTRTYDFSLLTDKDGNIAKIAAVDRPETHPPPRDR